MLLHRAKVDSAVKIQAWCRQLQRRRQPAPEVRANAPVILQRWWRRAVKRKRYRKLLGHLEEAGRYATRIQAVWRGHFFRKRVWGGLLHLLQRRRFHDEQKEMRRLMHALLQERMRPYIPPRGEMLNKEDGHLVLTARAFDPEGQVDQSWWNNRRLEALASPTSSASDSKPPSLSDLTRVVHTEYAKALHRPVEIPPAQPSISFQGWHLPVQQSLHAAHKAAVEATRTPADCFKSSEWNSTLRGYGKKPKRPVRHRQAHTLPSLRHTPLQQQHVEEDDAASVSSSLVEGFFGPQKLQRRALRVPVEYSQGTVAHSVHHTAESSSRSGRSRKGAPRIPAAAALAKTAPVPTLATGGSEALHLANTSPSTAAARYLELHATQWGALLLHKKPPSPLGPPVCSMVLAQPEQQVRVARTPRVHQRLHHLPTRHVRDRAALLGPAPEKPAWV